MQAYGSYKLRSSAFINNCDLSGVRTRCQAIDSESYRNLRRPHRIDLAFRRSEHAVQCHPISAVWRICRIHPTG